MKKNKCTLFAVAALLSVAGTADAQNNAETLGYPKSDKRFYIKVDAGYNFRAVRHQYQDISNSYLADNTTVSHYKGHPYSYGAGFMPSLAGGVMFNKIIGAELRFSYLSGTEQTLSDAKDYYPNGYSHITQTSRPKMYYLTPMLVLQGNLNHGTIKPYMKMGPVFGFGGNIVTKINNSYSNGNTSNTQYLELKESGGMAVGIAAGGGVEFELNRMFSVCGEVTYTGLSFSPEKGITTANTVNGVDKIPTMTTYQKEVQFVDNYDKTTVTDPYGRTTTVSNPNEPAKLLKQYYPFSNIGFQAGIKITFGK